MISNNNSEKEVSKIFGNDAICNFSKLYTSLNRVYIRLVREGYKIEGSKIIPPKKF